MSLISEFLRHRIKSFSDAFNGITLAFRSEVHFKIHLFFTWLAIGAGFVFSISPVEWGLIILVIGFVWVSEMINTAIERSVDMITTDYHPLAKQAKDISAGAVLIASFISVLIGLIVFLPKIFN